MSKKDSGKVHAPTFGKVMKSLMHDLSITDGAVRLYAHMHWRYGDNKDNHEGQAKMAAFLGVSEKTIRNRLDELEAHDWVITIYQDPDEKKQWQRSYYHVFETQAECRKFRAEYIPGELETVKPKPVARERVSRKGKGNTEAVPPPVRKNSSSNGARQKPSSNGGQNSGSAGRKNSGSDNLDSLYLDSSIQTQKDSSPSGDAPAEKLFDVLSKLMFPDEPALTKADNALVGIATAWLEGRKPTARQNKRGLEQLEIPCAIPELKKFFSWYRVSPDTRNANFPVDVLKLRKHFSDYRKIYPPQDTAATEQEYYTPTADELAHMEAVKAAALERMNGNAKRQSA